MLLQAIPCGKNASGFLSVSLVGAEPSFATPRLSAAIGVGVGWELAK